jgi:DNA-binding SARP family transcriptional activator
LGGLFLDKDGARVDGSAAQRKRLATLAIIASDPVAGATRDELAALLWPESDESRARNALYQAVAAIRRDLGSDALIAGAAGDLRLNERFVTSDIGDFQTALAQGDLERAVAHYAGPFLDGVHIREAPEFERWAEELRRNCALRHQDTLSELAKRAASVGDHALAVRWLRRLAEADTLSVPVTLRLMEALAATGDRDAAIRQGRIYTEVVRSTLEDEPDNRVTALMSALSKSVNVPVVVGNGPSAKDVGPGPSLDALDATPAPDGSESRRSPGIVPNQATKRTGNRRATRMTVIGGAAALVLVTGVTIALRTSAPTPGPALDTKRVVVADFENRTGDTTFDLLGATLADWVTQGLTQTGVARIVDPASRSAVRQYDPKLSTATGKARALAMARVANAGTVVSGTIYRQGNDLVVRAQINDVVADRILVSLDPISSPPNDPLMRADALRDRIAGALATAFDVQVRSLTLPSSRPPTFAAYQEYVLGLEAFQRGRESAFSHFRRSAELDTTFSLPLIWAVFSKSPFKDDSTIALLARRRPPPGTLEELQLQVFQAWAKDPNEELLLLQRGARLSPGSTWSWNAGQEFHNARRLREAVQYWNEIDLEHSWVGPWLGFWKVFVEDLHELGRYDEELRAARTYLKLFPSPSGPPVEGDAGPYMRAHEGFALIALGRGKEARGVLERHLTSLGLHHCFKENASDIYQAITLEFLAHGDTANAAEYNRRWIELCEQSVAIDTAKNAPGSSYAERSGSRLWLGIAYYYGGRYAEAERELTWAKTRPDADAGSRGIAAGFLGRIAARRGDREAAARAQREIPNSNPPFPVDGTGNLSESYAVIQSMLGEPEKAVERLRTSKDEIFFLHFHRDPDFKALWSYAPFVEFAAPK